MAGYVGEIYTVYRRFYGTKKEKLQIESQKPAGHYYYDRWYYPADSTRMNFLADKARELKRENCAENRRVFWRRIIVLPAYFT